MTYSQKLRDPRWQKKRLQILQRDGWRCKACGSSSKNLQVHHLYYAKLDPWEYPDIVYQTLCEDCHNERQAMVDNCINDVRLMLRNVSTEKLGGVLLSIIKSARKHSEGKNLITDEWKLKTSPEVESENPKVDLFKAMREAAK